jgi:AcrR family transcriptional regulator
MDRKPGRPRALTVDAIAQAALDDGVDTFSMPSIARRLGVAHSGLYRYIQDREELLSLALDRAFDSVEFPADDLPWEQLLAGIGDAIWAACDAYPGLDRAAQLAKEPSRVVLAHMERWVEVIGSHGFSAGDAAVAVEFPIALALDCSTQMARLRRMEAAHPDRSTLPVISPFDNDEVWRGRGLYQRKLDIFIAGLATRRQAT